MCINLKHYIAFRSAVCLQDLFLLMCIAAIYLVTAVNFIMSLPYLFINFPFELSPKYFLLFNLLSQTVILRIFLYIDKCSCKCTRVSLGSRV